ncbi:hypothetical protein LTR10_010789 [Elasticomyces elasticus]|nr:hypothetical protein LTR10_010789 [Elasticomyces elasticus]KAK4968395.1 hypothetical protein LTR42_009678 [Elasticomyces elasticus]
MNVEDRLIQAKPIMHGFDRTVHTSFVNLASRWIIKSRMPTLPPPTSLDAPPFAGAMPNDFWLLAYSLGSTASASSGSRTSLTSPKQGSGPSHRLPVLARSAHALPRANSTAPMLLSAQIHDRLLDPALLPPLLQAIRSAVFPNNVLEPGRPAPTPEETAEIKCECARAIVDVLPGTVRTLYFATTDTARMYADVESMLDLFGDAYINKHLIVAALELVVVRLFPELAQTVE